MTFLLESPATIEGIGPQRAQALAASGIETIADMFGAGAPKVATLLSGASAAQVGQWFCAGALRRVEGVTPDIAEAFVEGGVRSVGQLAEAGLSALEAAVKTARDASKLHQDLSLYQLADLQTKAWRIRGQGMLAGQVLDDAGAPIAGVSVDIGRDETTVDAKGRYAFERVNAGRVSPVLTVPGRSQPLNALPREIRAGKLTGPVRHRLGPAPATPLSLVRDEMDGDLFVHTARYRNRLVMLPLTDFRDGTYLLIREIKASGETRLLSLYKKRQDEVTLIQRASVQRGDLPAGAGVGAVVQLQSGRLAATSLTAAAVADLKWQKWLATHPSRSRTVITVS